MNAEINGGVSNICRLTFQAGQSTHPIRQRKELRVVRRPGML
jgi:hypothetical protein